MTTKGISARLLLAFGVGLLALVALRTGRVAAWWQNRIGASIAGGCEYELSGIDSATPAATRDTMLEVVRSRYPTSTVTLEGNRLTLSGYSGEQCKQETFALTRRGLLGIYHVLEGSDTENELRRIYGSLQPANIAMEMDGWTDKRGRQHSVPYWMSADSKALARFIAASSPTKGETVMLELFSDDRNSSIWRTYVVATPPVVTSRDIVSARATNDPATNAPLVLVEFSPSGAMAFGEFTAAVTGSKAAIVIDSVVYSAPIIIEPIRGGTVSISLRQAPRKEVEWEAKILSQVLSGGRELPVEISALVIGSRSRSVALLWGIPLGVACAVAAIVFFGCGWLGKQLNAKMGLDIKSVPFGLPQIAFANPKAALVRVVVTVAAGAFVWWSQRANLLSVARWSDLDQIMDDSPPTIFFLGILPWLAGFQIVQFVAWLVPSLRNQRNAASAERRKIDIAAHVVSLVAALAMGWLFANYFSSFANSVGATAPSRLLVALSVAAASALVWLVAGVITRWGLCNGAYFVTAVLFVPRLHSATEFVLFVAAAAVGLAITRSTVAGHRIPRTGIVVVQTTALIGMFLSLITVFWHDAQLEWNEWWSSLPWWGSVVFAAAVSAVLSFGKAALWIEIILWTSIAAFGVYALQLAPAWQFPMLMWLGIILHDLVASAIGRMSLGDAVPVLELHDPDEATKLTNDLRAAGHEVLIENANARSFARGVDAYTPTAIWVKRSDADAVFKLLGTRSGA